MQEKRFSTRYGLNQSLDSTFTILSNIATDPFTITFTHRGKTHHKEYEPPDNIIMSDKLFRQYDCLDYSCSRCCWKTRYWNIFSPDQYERLPTAHKGYAKELTVDIDGATFPFMVEDKTEELCAHLDDDRCDIHEENPIHCALPLIKFKRTTRRDGSKSTYITREVYTRNWHMCCPATFEPIDEEGYQKTLWIFHRVKDMAEELGISTSIDHIIDDVHNHKERNIGPLF